MILNHLWGLYAHPEDEWQSIKNRHEHMMYSLSHILIIALVPTICSYFSAVYLGWYLSFGETTELAPLKAGLAAIVLYGLMIGGVFALAFIAWRLAIYMGATPTLNQAVELASYASTPLFMTGFCALYPETWFLFIGSCAGLVYSTYLLFSGVAILIHVDEDKRRTYSLALVACGLLLLIGLLAVMMSVFGA